MSISRKCIFPIWRAGIENVDGTTLTGEAFSTVIPFGDKFLAISIVLFAFATMVGWAYFGERTAAYLFGEKSAFLYKMVYVLMILPGCMMTPHLAWEVGGYVQWIDGIAEYDSFDFA